MGIKIDIKANDLKTLLALLQQYLPNTLVWAFGSRVKFTSKPASDLDLVAFITEKQKMSFSLLKDALAESALPFRVDLHDWNDIPENFRKNIEGSYLVIQKTEDEKRPDNWKLYRLGDFAEINPKVSLKQGIVYSFVEMKDLDSTFKYVSPSTKKELKGGAKFQNGDTLFARITPCLENGKICQVKNLENNVGFGSTEFLVFRGRKNVSNSDFVYYLSRSEFVKNNAIQMMTGSSGRQRVEKSALEELEIYVPEDIQTQSKIAQILSSLDDKIELNLQMNQTLEAMAQALFKEWFVDFKFPGFDGKYENGLPKGWRITKLSKVIDIKHGFAFKGEFFSDFEEDNILLTPGNFKIGGGFNSSKFKYYKGDIPTDYILERNDLIVTMTDLSKAGDTLGYSAIVPTIEGKQLLHNQRIGKVIFRSELPLKYYLYLVMCQDNYRHFVLGGATGSTVKHTSPKRICDFEFLFPDKATLFSFETIIKSLSDKQQENEFQINNLTQIRDTLLPKLMSGKLEIKH